MTRHPRIFALAAALVLLLAVAVSAQSGDKQVGIVIQFPDALHTEIVTAPADANTAEVLESATVSAALADMGFGPALCNIDGVGNPVDDCFADPEHFWAFYTLNGDAWEASPVGVGDHVPGDGEVVGFAWSGFDADFNPTVAPPPRTFAQLEGESGPDITLIILGILAAVLVAALAVYIPRLRRRAR